MTTACALRRALTGAAAAAAVTAATVAATSALYTDTTDSPPNTLTSLTLDVETSPSATGSLSLAGFSPGDYVATPLTITNAGTSPLRYNMRATSTENTVAKTFQNTVLGPGSCDGTTTPTSRTALRTGFLGDSTGVQYFGSTTPGQQAGDRILAAGASETLCMVIELPLSATNTVASATARVSFTVFAEQTKNNP